MGLLTWFLHQWRWAGGGGKLGPPDALQPKAPHLHMHPILGLYIMFGGGGWGRRRFHFLEEKGGFWSPHCWSVLCSPMILGQNSASPTDFKNKGQKGVIGEERPKGWPVSMYKAMDGDRPKPLDGPRGAANFLSLFPPEVSSINLCEGRNIFTCPWMAFTENVYSFFQRQYRFFVLKSRIYQPLQFEQFYSLDEDWSNLICFDTQGVHGFIQSCNSAVRNVLLITPRYIKN